MFSKSMEHFVCCFVRYLIAVEVTSLQAFIWRSLREIDCCINCFSTNLNGGLGVKQHSVGLFPDCTDHSFGHTILIVSLWREWLICFASSRKDISEGFIVVFPSSIISSESLDLVSHPVYLELK